MEGFKILPHTSEVGLWIGGESFETFYRNAARGLFDIMGIGGLCGPSCGRSGFRLAGDTPEELLVDWLNELIYRVAAERRALLDISIEEATAFTLRGGLGGPSIPAGAGPALEVKAATYHGLKVERKDGLWTASVILDV